MKTILSVIGTRPNFMKVGPIEEQLKQKPQFRHVILHTGQHYDSNMSDDFFRDFGLRAPDIYLGVHGGKLGDQTGRIMTAFEKELLQVRPDMVVVVGDVNSTFAAAWVAVQNHIPVAHVESGLRSFDRRMPEEINRICTDVIADLLLTTHPMGDEQLIKEGIDPAKIHMVGDVMIDYLVKHRERALGMREWEKFGLKEKGYAVATLHRPSNVDNPEQLSELVDTLIKIAAQLPIVFPVHPRTAENLKKFNLHSKLANAPGIKLSPPLSYLHFISLVLKSAMVMTDSGGLQEETTFLNIPCMTLRENTERPFCVTEGSNYLVGTSPKNILATFQTIFSGKAKQAHSMEGWDGNAAARIVKILEAYLSQR